MSEILKKPYEISVWEDELVTLENGESYYKEKKSSKSTTSIVRGKVSKFYRFPRRISTI